MRGAIFFIGEILWGRSRIPGLKYSPMTVLPVISTALTSPQQAVLYEVVVQVNTSKRKTSRMHCLCCMILGSLCTLRCRSNCW